MLYEVLGVVTPVFIVAAIGFAWIKRGQPFDNETVSSLVMYIGSPCLIYSSLTSNTPTEAALMTMIVAAAGSILLCGLLGAVILRLLKWPLPTYLPSLIQANSGNMGLPLVLLAFGPEGLALGMTLFFVNSISQFTLGVAISSGRFEPKTLLKQPVIWSVALTLLLIFNDVQMPTWFNATAELLGGLTIPAMLLMLGTSIARLRAGGLAQATWVSILRLLLGFAVGHVLVWLLDLDGMIAGVIILQCTMPAAVFNYVFAERYNRQPDQVAAVVLQSTLLSLLTLPLLVGYVMAL